MKYRLSQGFNIIELMIVIAIVGILVTAAAPSFRETLINQKIAGYTSTLYQNIQQARSQARSLRSNSFLLAESGTSIVPGVANNWTKGWRVAITNNEVLTLDTSQENPQSGDAIQSVSISVRTTGGAALNQFGFNRFGQLINSSGSIITGISIIVCSNQSTTEKFKRITIDSTGNMKIISKSSTDIDIAC